MVKIRAFGLIFFVAISLNVRAQSLPKEPVKTLVQLQQDFVDLRFGMFIHFNIPTYMNQAGPTRRHPLPYLIQSSSIAINGLKPLNQLT
jgi:hypothetical protein